LTSLVEIGAAECKNPDVRLVIHGKKEESMAEATNWSLTGEYFETCSCDVVCPCEISPKGFMQADPDNGYCNVVLVFHLNEGKFGDVNLSNLNVIMAARAVGPMAGGNWTVAAYLDERASPEQQQALGAIFGGAAGGPPSALAPLIGENLGAQVVPIEYRNEGKKRSARISGVLDANIEAVPSPFPDEVVVKLNANPLFPGENWVQAYGVKSTYTDHAFNWDNTGKCADYSIFRWSGP
jgi:hypothetical protein